MFACIKLCTIYQWYKSNLWKKSEEVAKDARDIQDAIAIVTGSNCGLGKYTALQLATRGAHVIMACRDVKKAEEAKTEMLEACPDAKLTIEQVDFGDLASVREFAKRIKERYPRVDILVNNAGVFFNTTSKTKDGFETSMQVNHLGHFLLTMLLVEHMKKPSGATPSRIIWVSSSMQAFANLDLDNINLENVTDLGFCSFLPYANSKLGNALTSRELGERLRHLGINSYAMCPGLVKTEVFRYENEFRKYVSEICLYFGGVSIQSGCKTILHCALSKSLDNESGLFYRFLSRWDPDLSYYDDAFSKRFWDECEKMCGIPGFSHELEKMKA